MAKRLRTLLLLATVMVAGTSWGSAKCISLKIAVEGEIVGTLNGFTVKVDVPTKTKSDPVTRVS